MGALLKEVLGTSEFVIDVEPDHAYQDYEVTMYVLLKKCSMQRTMSTFGLVEGTTKIEEQRKEVYIDVTDNYDLIIKKGKESGLCSLFVQGSCPRTTTTVTLTRRPLAAAAASRSGLGFRLRV